MKYVVITGGQGYIGSALANRLAQDGRVVRLVSYFSPAQTIAANAQVELVRADLRDAANWSSLLTDAEAVVHLSWRTNLRAAEADPAGDRQLNVEPVQALVRAAERCSQPVPVTFASTVTIVGDAPPIPADERTPDRPCTVYDRHKLESEIILRDATRRGVLNACSLRLPNVYGYGSGVGSTIPIAAFSMKSCGARCWVKRAPLMARAGYVCDFTFIGDVLYAFCPHFRRSACANAAITSSQAARADAAKAFELVAREASGFTGRAVEIRHVPEPPDLLPIERRNFVGNSSLSRNLQAGIDNSIANRNSRLFRARHNALESGPVPDEAA